MATGNELVGTLRDGRRAERHVLRVGAVDTLSRNFERAFLAPVLSDPSLSLALQSGSVSEFWPASAPTRSMWCCQTGACLKMPIRRGEADASPDNR